MKGFKNRKGWGGEGLAQKPAARVYLILGIGLSLKGILAPSPYVLGGFLFQFS